MDRLRSLEKLYSEGFALAGVCMPRVTHPVGVGWPFWEPCLGGALWSAAKRACLDLGAVSLLLKLQNQAIARAPHETD